MPRRYPHYLFKFFNEIKIVIKAHRLADFRQAQVRGGKQLLGLADSQLCQILGIGEARFVFNQKAYIGGIQVKSPESFFRETSFS